MEQTPLWEADNVGTGAAVAAPEVPIWKRYTLTIKQAAAYFGIGENKLRDICRENHDANYVLWNGSRPQIKRPLFEKYINGCNLI